MNKILMKTDQLVTFYVITFKIPLIDKKKGTDDIPNCSGAD